MSNAFYSQYHESRLGGDVVGNLTRGCVVDRLAAMRRRERTAYRLDPVAHRRCAGVVPPSLASTPVLSASWREKICHWSFNVVDHFDFSREVVAVSMSLFDRYLAARGNRCSGSMALLASLTTLHIAIKVHEMRKVRLTTLANLSRGQFGPKHIEEMEWVILTSLNWHIHPPTSMSFLSHLLLLLPPQVSDATKEDIYTLSRYISELSVCDSSFVEIDSSAVAFASILNALEDRRYRRLISSSVRDQFLRAIATHVGIRQDDEQVLAARPKLRRLLTSSMGQGQEYAPQEHVEQQQLQHQQSVQSSATLESVTYSVNSLQINDSKADDSSSSTRHSRHSRSSSYDSITGHRRGRRIAPNASPRASRARVAPSPSSRSILSTSSYSLSSRSAMSIFSRHSRSPMTSLLPAS